MPRTNTNAPNAARPPEAASTTLIPPHPCQGECVDGECGVMLRVSRPCRTALVSALVLAAMTARPAATHAQASPKTPESHLTIPYLANTSSDEIEFAAAECDISATGSDMTCRFRQVFITRASFDQTACVITSNGYEQRFHRETPVRWVSTTPPEGDCGLVDTTVLDDGGGTRWTMTVSSRATRAGDRPACQAAASTPGVYSWRDVKRPLTCATIQPGSIER